MTNSCEKMKLLYGYVDGKRVGIQNTPEQITAFIMANVYADTTITTPLDSFVLNTVCGGFIMNCPDQKFLTEKLLPVLQPVQLGMKEVPEFIPIQVDNDEDEEYY